MRRHLFLFFDRSSLLALAFGCLFSVLSILPLSWHETLENFLIDQLFKLRGSRPWSENFVLVAIGAQDIQALGGWPLTRDYYGYVLHFLNSRGARTLGFDLLWDRPHALYPEHDAMLASLLAARPSVCLPFVFSDFESAISPAPGHSDFPQHAYAGHQPIFPLPEFRQSLAGMGFGNLERTAMPRKMPVVAAFRDSLTLAFGAELARLFLGGAQAPEIRPHALVLFDSAQGVHEIPLDAQGRMRLNYLGEGHELNTLNFVELLRISQKNPDSLDWHGKMVLVAVSDPTLTTIKATPLAKALPASVIHLTVAENIVQRNYLREAGSALQMIMILLFAGFGASLARLKNVRSLLLVGGVLAMLYALLAVWLFARWNFVLPLFYPLLASLATLVSIVYAQRQRERGWEAAQQKLLGEQITATRAQWEEAESRLTETQKQLSQYATLSAKDRQLVEEQKQKIFTLEKQLRDLQAYENAAPGEILREFNEVVCTPESPMAQVLALVPKVAGDDIPVLICGETGTGKELVARAIHRAGPRRHKPFVAINCSALPESLLESELFGHEKGSFTGAQAQRRGRFEIATGGTLFLDEITETSPALQARLLRVLQEGTFERVGGEQTLKADVHVLAACNRDLQKEIERGRFRVDLFYRLNGFQIVLPPLRERSEDIPLLASHFLRKHDYKGVERFSNAAMAALQNHAWPGNVRELENAVRRAAVLAQSEGRALIQAEDLPKDIAAEGEAARAPVSYRALPDQILEMLRAMKFSHSAISQTAKALGNRDRGTITEYLRGMCFEHFVQANFVLEAAARSLAESAEEETVQRARTKIEAYLANLRAATAARANKKNDQAGMEQACKGLPKKYHACVQRIFAHWEETSGE